MKFTLSTGLLAIAAQLVSVSGHYTFPFLITSGNVTTGEYQYVRITENHYSNGPITDVKSSQFRCYELDSTSASKTGTATVTAGSSVGFKADAQMGHPGYFNVYLAAVSAANSPSAGSGAVWFKIWDWAPKYSKTTGLVFDTTAGGGITTLNFNIPKSVPSGQYLMRVEHIALHAAGSYQGAQFYIACAQLNIVGGGSGSPSPKVAIPGVYTGYEPGILINMYNLPANFTGYTAPGPAVWRG